jgi:serine/threonine protein kinase
LEKVGPSERRGALRGRFFCRQFVLNSSCHRLASLFSSQVIDDAALDKLYLVSEFVDGGSLMRDEKTGDPLPLPKVRHYMQQLLSAVSYLHFMRVVHRDIKPGNILIAKDGTLKVTDFGVSQVLEASSADELRSTAGTAAFQVWLIIKQPIYVRYCFLTRLFSFHPLQFYRHLRCSLGVALAA